MKVLTCYRWTRSVSTTAARLRTRSRTASWLSSGTYTVVNSPARSTGYEKQRPGDSSSRDRRASSGSSTAQPGCIRGRTIRLGDIDRSPSGPVRNRKPAIKTTRYSLDNSTHAARRRIGLTEETNLSFPASFPIAMRFLSCATFSSAQKLLTASPYRGTDGDA